MKMIWVALGIIVVISLSAAGLYIYSAGLQRDLQRELVELEQAAEAENWAQVQQASARLKKAWKQADATWSPVMDRRDVDRVDEAVARVAHLSAHRQKDDLLLEVSVARRVVTRLMQKESISFHSLF